MLSAAEAACDAAWQVRDPNGQILSSHGPGGTVNYVSEYNGSVLALSNPAGAEVGSYRYSPYGRTTVTGTSAAANPFRYVGGYHDKDANGGDGYYKLGARFYDTQGHFTQPDAIAGSIGDPKTLTSYNYAGGDPINSSDPSGNSFIDDLGFDGAGDRLAGLGRGLVKAANYIGSCATGAVTGSAIFAGGGALVSGFAGASLAAPFGGVLGCEAGVIAEYNGAQIEGVPGY